MRVKKIQIDFKDVKTALDDFIRATNKVASGGPVKKETAVYFTSFEAFRKALTPKRIELMHAIKTLKPSSINHLARLLKRDIKNTAEDVKYLEQVGLIEKKTVSKEIRPSIHYDKITFEIAV